MAMFGFVVLEYVRIVALPPLGNFIAKNIQLFIDHRDRGTFILTHIYLLAGCAIPVWVSDHPIHASVGILVLGVGDSMVFDYVF